MLKKLAALAMTLLCAVGFMFPASTVYADTDGTELTVTDEVETLEIQLGAAWAGVEFELKTDVGTYPGTIVVGEDGVLRTELGGSKTYVLSCANSTVAAPAPAETQEPATSEDPATDPTTSPASEPTAAPEEPAESPEGEPAQDGEETGNETGIPTKNIILFGGGMVAAIGALVGISIAKKRRNGGGRNNSYYDDDDDEE